MSKILANQIANYGDDAPIELKEGLNIPAGKPIQAAGASGTAGQILSSTGTTVEWIDNFSGSYNDLSDTPTIPAAQVRADWNAVGSIAEILNKPIVPPVPSVTVNAPGTANLTYASLNGEFTYTPPDLSSYLTAEVDTLDTVTGRGATTANSIDVGGLNVGDNISITSSPHGQIQFRADSNGSDQGRIQGVEANLSITPGTTGHVSIGTYSIFYPDGNVILNLGGQSGTTQFNNGFSVTGGSISGIDIEDLDNVDITAGLSDQQVLKWDAASSSWKPANDLVGGAQGIQFVDLSVSTAPAGSAALSYNNTNGVFTYTPPDLSGYATTAAVANAANWDTAYGWGDHAAAGYLTAYTETDPVFTASAAAGITLTKINQWDTAYGWGNHANGGYLVATAQDKTNWNTAFGWGDHSTEGYLTSFTETDPVFSASVAAGISGAEVANWNTAYGWGDHSVEGYLTSTGSINTHTDITITTPVNGEVLAYNGSQWVNTSSASIANATISDTAPGSPTVGDLWWESDKGRLKIYYNDTDSQQWVDASPPLAQPNVPVAAGCITLNGTSPTWTGTAGYTVAHSGGGGSDEVYTLTFPSAYGARTDYIVNADYDGTNWIAGNGAQLGIVRNAGNVQITVRRWNEDPLNQGEIMITIHNL